MEKAPLRERKKTQTRQRILHAAEELVQLEGYQSVTIAAICDKADIAQRTFFAYFPSKEAAFFYSKQLMLDDMAASLLNRSEDETTFQVLRKVLASTIEACMSDGGKALMQAHMRMEQANPQLQMYGDHLNRQCEDILRESIARDLHEPADALGPTLAAASANSTLGTIFKKSVTDISTSKKEVLEILDKTLSFLEAGIFALDTSDKKH